MEVKSDYTGGDKIIDPNQSIGGEVEGAKKRRLLKFENLPVPIIHHIMDSLSIKECGRLSTLSRTLYYIWLSYPVMDFDGSLFAVNEYPERFFSLVLRSLELHGPHINNTLRKLRLFFREDRPPVLYDNFPNILQTLLCFALNNKCIELDLNFNITCPNLDKPWWDFSNYILDIQKVIFIPLFTSRYLTTLKLKGFNFVIPPLPEPTDDETESDSDSESESEQVLVIACPALRNLLLSNCKGLRNVKVLSRELDEVEIDCCNAMRKVSVHTSFLGCFKFVGGQPGLFFNVRAQTCDIDLSGCEQLNFVSLDTLKVSAQFIQQTQAQMLYLLRCQMPRKVIIYNPHIKIMEMRMSQMNMESFVLNAPNLEFLEYRSSDQRLKFDISACLALKVLIFRGAAFTDAWVNKLIPKFKFLERLELSQCHSLEKIDLKHQNLQAFTLHACFQLKEAVVDGRNLLNFTYSGNLRVYPMLVTSAKCSAQIELLEQANRPESWFSILRRFLCQFDHFKCITVSCASVEDLIFPREFVRAHVSPLHDVRLMNVKMREKPTAQTLIQLLESVLWLLPKPEALTFEHGFTKTRGILKFEYARKLCSEETVEDYVRMRCCHVAPIKCWRHFGVQVTREGFNFDDHCNEYLDRFFAPYIKKSS